MFSSLLTKYQNRFRNIKIAILVYIVFMECIVDEIKNIKVAVVCTRFCRLDAKQKSNNKSENKVFSMRKSGCIKVL